MISADLAGLAGLLQILTRDKRVEDAARRALEREAETLAAAIRAAAPEDTGALKESVRVEPGGEPLTVAVVAGGDANTLKPASSGVVYDEALLAEYGTRKAAPRPFFWPTVERMRGKLKARIEADLSKEAND